MKSMLVVTAVGEAAIGLAALVYPPIVVYLLLGADVAGAGEVMSRVAGAALFAIASACWLASSETQGPALRGLVTGVLIYDLAVAAILAQAGLGLGSVGVVLWPAVGLHAALALWCALCLWSPRRVRGHDGTR